MKRRIAAGLLALACLLSACGNTSAEPAALTTETVSSPPLETTASPESTAPEPSLSAFVRVLDYIPSARQELMYATNHNFTGQVIYDFSDAYLRYGTVKKLEAVCADLSELGLSLKIWDGFRPVSAQFKLWEVCPDPAFVANPETGFSSHSRGSTVDVTLVDETGTELEMPTGFDDFSAKADRDYSDCTETAAAHAQLLEILMEKHGFKGYSGEWWHFSDTDEYPVEQSFIPS